MARRCFRREDGAVSEVVGFVLSFALSAIFLLIAMNTFWVAKDNTDNVVTAVELKTIANRVASRIVEASLVAQEFPNATLNMTVPLPQDLNGRPYFVKATASEVLVYSADGSLSASATTFKLEAVPNVRVAGLVASSNEVLIITYSLQPNAADPTNPFRDIRIHGEE